MTTPMPMRTFCRSDNNTATLIWNAQYDGINRVNQILKHVPDLTDLVGRRQSRHTGSGLFSPRAPVSQPCKTVGRRFRCGWSQSRPRPRRATITRATVRGSVHADSGGPGAGGGDDHQYQYATGHGGSRISQSRPGCAFTRQTTLGPRQRRRRLSLWATRSLRHTPRCSTRPATTLRKTFSGSPSLRHSRQLVELLLSAPSRWVAATRSRPIRASSSAYDPNSGGVFATYHPTDARGIYDISRQGTRTYSSKFRNPAGDEDLHVIRLGEVILIRAEALAQLNRLPEAVAEYNRLRVRAGLAPDPVVGLTQAGVLAAIARERRLELAFEGDRWADIVRTGVGNRPRRPCESDSASNSSRRARHGSRA